MRAHTRAVAAGAIGAMLQGGALLDDATVGETVGLVASLHRAPLPVAEALRRSGIEDLAGRRCGKLSGGQKQRVRFAVALVSKPDLLVLDEPTAAMDVHSRRELWRSMHGFTDSGRTVLFATHYLVEAENYADRVVLMRAGRIVADGSVAEVTALVSGRVIRAAVPGAREIALRLLPGVSEVEARASRVAISTTDSDTTLRALLATYPQAHNIEVSAVGLEGAFLSLTGDAADDPETANRLGAHGGSASRGDSISSGDLALPSNSVSLGDPASPRELTSPGNLISSGDLALPSNSASSRNPALPGGSASSVKSTSPTGSALLDGSALPDNPASFRNAALPGDSASSRNPALPGGSASSVKSTSPTGSALPGGSALPSGPALSGGPVVPNRSNGGPR